MFHRLSSFFGRFTWQFSLCLVVMAILCACLLESVFPGMRIGGRVDEVFQVVFALIFFVAFSSLGLSGLFGILDCLTRKEPADRRHGMVANVLMALFGVYGAASIGYVVCTRML